MAVVPGAVGSGFPTVQTLTVPFGAGVFVFIDPSFVLKSRVRESCFEGSTRLLHVRARERAKVLLPRERVMVLTGSRARSPILVPLDRPRSFVAPDREDIFRPRGHVLVVTAPDREDVLGSDGPSLVFTPPRRRVQMVASRG